jgi:hypothetical protein
MTSCGTEGTWRIDRARPGRRPSVIRQETLTEGRVFLAQPAGDVALLVRPFSRASPRVPGCPLPDGAAAHAHPRCGYAWLPR